MGAAAGTLQAAGFDNIPEDPETQKALFKHLRAELHRKERELGLVALENDSVPMASPSAPRSPLTAASSPGGGALDLHARGIGQTNNSMRPLNLPRPRNLAALQQLAGSPGGSGGGGTARSGATVPVTPSPRVIPAAPSSSRTPKDGDDTRNNNTSNDEQLAPESLAPGETDPAGYRYAGYGYYNSDDAAGAAPSSRLVKVEYSFAARDEVEYSITAGDMVEVYEQDVTGEWSFGRKAGRGGAGGSGVAPTADGGAAAESVAAGGGGGGWFPTSCLGASHPFLTEDELSVLDALNAARTDPEGFARQVEARASYLDAENVLWLPGREKGLRSKEGKACFQEAAEFLRRVGAQQQQGQQGQEPLAPLQIVYGMTLAARDHARDTGPKSIMGHGGSDGSTMGSRLSRYGKWSGSCGENLDYGRAKTGLDVVLTWIIDDGVLSRGHRRNIFRRDATVCGIGASAHAVHGSVWVVELAGGFTELDVVELNLRHAALSATYRAQAEGWAPCPGCGLPTSAPRAHDPLAPPSGAMSMASSSSSLGLSASASASSLFPPQSPATWHYDDQHQQQQQQQQQGDLQGTTTFVGEYRWHNRCIKCSDCHKPLASFRAHNNRPYCLECYYANHATRCHSCKLPITGQYISHKESAFCAKCWNKLGEQLLRPRVAVPPAATPAQGAAVTAEG